MYNNSLLYNNSNRTYHIAVSMLYVITICFHLIPAYVVIIKVLFFDRLLFTALHGMQTQSSDENSVRSSACLSVSQTREL